MFSSSTMDEGLHAVFFVTLNYRDLFYQKVFCRNYVVFWILSVLN